MSHVGIVTGPFKGVLGNLIYFRERDPLTRYGPSTGWFGRERPFRPDPDPMTEGGLFGSKEVPGLSLDVKCLMASVRVLKFEKRTILVTLLSLNIP